MDQASNYHAGPHESLCTSARVLCMQDCANTLWGCFYVIGSAEFFGPVVLRGGVESGRRQQISKVVRA